MLEITGLAEFEKAINAYADKVEQTPRKVAKKLILDLHRQTVLLTPVDTGRLVGGWQITTGDRPAFHQNAYADDTDRKGIEREVKQSQIAYEQNRRDYDFRRRFYWVANNVEYARWREYGTDRTRGKFMLQQAIQRVTARAYELAREAFSE